jgi:hypothetical protein
VSKGIQTIIAELVPMISRETARCEVPGVWFNLLIAGVLVSWETELIYKPSSENVLADDWFGLLAQVTCA